MHKNALTENSVHKPKFNRIFLFPPLNRLFVWSSRNFSSGIYISYICRLGNEGFSFNLLLSYDDNTCTHRHRRRNTKKQLKVGFTDSGYPKCVNLTKSQIWKVYPKIILSIPLMRKRNKIIYDRLSQMKQTSNKK